MRWHASEGSHHLSGSGDSDPETCGMKVKILGKLNLHGHQLHTDHVLFVSICQSSYIQVLTRK